MNTALNARKSTRREALFAVAASFGLLAFMSMGLDAQENMPKIGDKGEKPVVEKKKEGHERIDSLVEAGYTRPGSPDDKFAPDGKILEVGFTGANVQKYKIMGGTVYFSVFKNTGLVEGDTFGTGLPNLDSRFKTGRSFKDSYSPNFDRSAKYLYLYQVVNDRSLDPRINPVKGEKGAGGARWAGFEPGAKIDAKAKIPQTEAIASFALKLLVDPRYIKSWGHFSGAGFAAKVVDEDSAGKPVRQVVDKAEVDKEIRLAFSYLPAIVTKLPDSAYRARARSHSLGDLQNGFGVDQSGVNLHKSKAYSDLKQVSVQLEKDKGDVRLVGFVSGLLNAADSAREPEYVQLMYMANEERNVVGPVNMVEDDVTRAIFRVDWDRSKGLIPGDGGILKQGDRSVVFGFTTDLPPTAAPVRIDTPQAAAVSEGMRLASYFAEEPVARATGAVTAEGITLTAAGVDAAALALSVGSALGQAPTPVPAPAASPAGFAGITGGSSSGVGGTPSGVGGGFAAPSIGTPGGIGGGIGGGGGFEGGGGGTNGGNGTNGQGLTPSIVNTNTNTLSNKQQQQQQQQQQQSQHQGQHQGQHGGGNHGHVVPAPASLLLGLLGLPGLYFLRRRKTAATPEAAA